MPKKPIEIAPVELKIAIVEAVADMVAAGKVSLEQLPGTMAKMFNVVGYDDD